MLMHTGSGINQSGTNADDVACDNLGEDVLRLVRINVLAW